MTRRAYRGMGLLAALSLATTPLFAQVPAVSTLAQAITPSVGTDSVAADPYTWRGREAEIEDFLRHGPITHFKDIPVGITKPQRGYFAPGGPANSMAWKPLHDEVMHGKMESYRSEIAAYLLSRYLELDMVPPVVERQVKGVKGAAIFWIDGVRPWDPSSLPKGAGANWSRQTSRMFMFDQLIANIDRNQGNLLVDDAAHVFLIDHSRAFTPKPDLAGLKPPQQFDKALWNRMDGLSRADLDAVVGSWLTNLQIEALLSRRDAMRKHIERQVRERGDAVTFLPSAASSAAPAP
jgi:Phosphatidylinositol 3- and 4-kinase